MMFYEERGINDATNFQRKAQDYMSRHLLRLPIAVEDILKYDETLQESNLDLKPTIADVVLSVLMALFQNQRSLVVEVILKFIDQTTDNNIKN